MSVQYILQQTGFKMGLNPSVQEQRSVLLRFVNTAAREIYQTSDMAGILEEQYFKVNPNQTIALPDYIGQVRAMREADSHAALNLSQMRPRYNQYNWQDEWRNWRVKGLSALQQSIRNQSGLVISVPAIETPAISVSIVGSTDDSSSISETIQMTSISIQTANNYTEISAITKNAVNNYDVTIADIDGNQLSYIANDKLKAEFQIIDVSNAPWLLPNTNPVIGWVEVLYKKALPWLQNDTDEFPAKGYDEVIIAKCFQLYFEEQGNIQLAIAFQTKATGLLAQIHEDANRGTDDTVAFVENPHDRIQPRTGFGRDWRQAWRIVGR